MDASFVKVIAALRRSWQLREELDAGIGFERCLKPTSLGATASGCCSTTARVSASHARAVRLNASDHDDAAVLGDSHGPALHTLSSKGAKLVLARRPDDSSV
jgi:hypothetical protein